MATIHSRPGGSPRRPARPRAELGADNPRADWASRREFLEGALRSVLWNPLGCPTPGRAGNVLVSVRIGVKTAASQPSSLLLMSVLEESIGFRGPDAFPGVARPAAAGRRPVASNEGAQLMAGKRKTNPAGSTNNLRGDVLRALGALKVATADQIQRIGAPHLTYRHMDRGSPSEQKTARTASHTGALADMRKHGLSETGGSTTAGERLRNLTLKGLE